MKEAIDSDEIGRNEVREELRRQIEARLGSWTKVSLWPSEPNDIYADGSLKLVLWPPGREHSSQTLEKWLDRALEGIPAPEKLPIRFALPNETIRMPLEKDIREYLALRRSAEFNSSGCQSARYLLNELIGQFRQLDQRIDRKIRDFYSTAAVPTGELRNLTVELLELGQPTEAKENLDTFFWRRLAAQGSTVELNP